MSSFQEIYSLADRIGLKVPDVDTFIDNLNSVGYLIKKGPKTYQVRWHSNSQVPSIVNGAKHFHASIISVYWTLYCVYDLNLKPLSKSKSLLIPSICLE